MLISSAAAAQAPSSKPFELDSLTIAGFRWRNVGPPTSWAASSDVVGHSEPVEDVLRRRRRRRHLEDDEQRRDLAPGVRRQARHLDGHARDRADRHESVWAGTGEPNSRNTIEPGGGVYKSTDGGMTWKFMGLEKTQHDRPHRRPSAQPEHRLRRGARRTRGTRIRSAVSTRPTDGGTTWKLIKFISDKAGFVDVALDPRIPNIVWASSWERVRGRTSSSAAARARRSGRRPTPARRGPKIKGGGFPETTKGRIGIAISPSNPNVVYTLVEADSVPDRKAGHGRQAAAKSPTRSLSLDGWRQDVDADERPATRGRSTTRRCASIRRIRIASTGRRRRSSVSDDGGKTVAQRDAAACTSTITGCGSIRMIPSTVIVGDDGGIAHDVRQGRQLRVPIEHLPIGQFYDVSYDYRGAVQRLRRRAGQRRVVRPEPSQARRHDHERDLVHDRRRRRLLHGAGSDRIRTSSAASRRAATSAG